jgi:hypothetical protein
MRHHTQRQYAGSLGECEQDARTMPITIDRTAISSVTSAPSIIWGNARNAWFQWKV